MKFSLLLCTLNRELLLDKCVQSLINQKYSNYEIIIVDQSDIINNKYYDDERIKYVHINTRGLSHARNIGLQLCDGDYVALIDDDATYREDFLSKARNYLDGNRCGILCGKVIDPETGEYYLKKTNSDRIIKINYSTAFSYCVSASMIINKDFLKDGFDEKFGIGACYGSGEETDIVFKVLSCNEKIIFLPDIVVYHKASSSEYNENKLYSYSCGTGALFKKHYIKSKNPIFIMLYLYSVGRSLVGAMLYYLGIRSQKKSTMILKGKVNGFTAYK